jgi:hypothetical protein
MGDAESPTPVSPPPPRRIPSWAQVRVWHLTLLVLFAAIAIADIQSQRITEPALVALAAGGLLLYGLIGWIAWWIAHRLQSRLGLVLVFCLYAIAMAALFLVATVMYLVIAHYYRTGGR